MKGEYTGAGRQLLGIWLTNACNLRCTYCYIKEKSDLTIDFDKAIEIIHSQLRQPGGILEVSFMGAEPLTRFDLIRRIVETILAEDWPRPVCFSAATNGTLLTEEMKPWLVEHRDVLMLGLSYDGEDEAQDINRSGSSAAIDRDFFIETWPDQMWKMTISRDTAGRIDRDIIAMHERGMAFSANAAYEEQAWTEEQIGGYELALYRLARYYADHPDVQPCNLLYSRLDAVICPEGERQPCYCSAGESFSFFDMQGRAYPCHMFSPMVLPEERTLHGQFLPQDTDYEDPRCSACPLRGVCYTCMGTNYAYRGDLRKRDPMHCRLFMAQIRASMYMMLLKAGRKTRYTQQDVRNMAAIRTLNEAFESGRIGME